MKITLCKDPFEYIIIDNTYTEQELNLIFLELDFFCASKNFTVPVNTNTAKFENGEIKKSNAGVFLDDVYKDRNFSNILKLNRKIFNLNVEQPSVIFNFLKESNFDKTLVSYYENNDYYKPHKDNSILTMLTYLYKSPKLFDGGDLLLNDYEIAFEPWFNRTYIIPSVVQHEVTTIKMKDDDCGKGFGRYCITNFIFKENFDISEQISNPV